MSPSTGQRHALLLRVSRARFDVRANAQVWRLHAVGLRVFLEVAVRLVQRDEALVHYETVAGAVVVIDEVVERHNVHHVASLLDTHLAGLRVESRTVAAAHPSLVHLHPSIGTTIPRHLCESAAMQAVW